MSDYLLAIIKPKKNFIGMKKDIMAYRSKDEMIEAANSFIQKGYSIFDISMNGHDIMLTLRNRSDDGA